MNITPQNVLVVIGLLLAVVSLFKPGWPLLSVAVILISAALLVGK